MPPEALTSPDLTYEPPRPETYDPNVALVGCGEITESHLAGYTDAGLDVVAFCDLVESHARERRDKFYPDADIYTDAEAVFARDDIDVVDIATHPDVRTPLVEDAIDAGKHVLTQKPFVLDLDVGERLIDRADERGVKLAVNQNGRWAPHWSYLRHSVAAGAIGTPTSAHLAVHWNHDWIADTNFDDIDHAILYDFAIHWYDFLACVMADHDPVEVHSGAVHSPTQSSRPPLLGQTMVSYEDAQASLVFDGHTRHGRHDRTSIVGPEGTLHSEGPDVNEQTVTLHTESGTTTPDLEGSWFPDGFRGTMGELLSAVEEDREPSNSARDNLRSLELCFAAVASAEDGEPKVPGEVRTLPGS